MSSNNIQCSVLRTLKSQTQSESGSMASCQNMPPQPRTMRHALEGVKRKYDMFRREWEEECRKRRRLTKSRPVAQNRQQASKLSRHDCSWGDVARGARLDQELLANTTIAIVYKGDAGSKRASSIGVHTSEEKSHGLQPAAHSEQPTAFSAGAHRDHISIERGSQGMGLAVEELPPLPSSPDYIDRPVSPMSSAGSSVLFHPRPSPTNAEERTHLQLERADSDAHAIPSASAPPVVALPTLADPSSSLDATSTTARTEPHVARMHQWLHSLQQASTTTGEWARPPTHRPSEAGQWLTEDVRPGESAAVMAGRKDSDSENGTVGLALRVVNSDT